MQYIDAYTRTSFRFFVLFLCVCGRTAVGCPVDGPSDRDANRNNVDDLSSWLESFHRGHFLVWNVSDHRADGHGTGGGNGGGSSGEGKVSRKLHQRLSGQVLDVPWVSPNRRCYVPSIRHLLRICYSIKVGESGLGRLFFIICYQCVCVFVLFCGSARDVCV